MPIQPEERSDKLCKMEHLSRPTPRESSGRALRIRLGIRHPYRGFSRCMARPSLRAPLEGEMFLLTSRFIERAIRRSAVLGGRCPVNVAHCRRMRSDGWRARYFGSFLSVFSQSACIFLTRASRSLSGFAASNFSATSRLPRTTSLTVRR